MQSTPVRTTGQYFIQTFPESFGLHRSGFNTAIRTLEHNQKHFNKMSIITLLNFSFILYSEFLIPITNCSDEHELISRTKKET